MLTGACEARGGEGHGQPHQCLRLPRMLCQDKRRREGGLRDGHQGRAAGQETWQEECVPAVIEASTWTGRRQGKGRAMRGGPENSEREGMGQDWVGLSFRCGCIGREGGEGVIRGERSPFVWHESPDL